MSLATLPHNGTITSRAAAISAAPKASSDNERILRHLAWRGKSGATTDEIEAALCLSHQTASARVRGLALKGRIIDHGERRPTRSGSKAVVWFAVTP